MCFLVVVFATLISATVVELPHIDVMIPATSKDSATLGETVRRLRRFSRNPIRRVVIVSPERLLKEEEWWPETRGYPFMSRDFARSANYQQQLKMYAHDAIEPPVLDNLLILDSDVWWQRHVTFVEADGTALYSPSEQAYDVFKYRRWFRTILSGIPRVAWNHCGVAHHMIFQRPVLTALKNAIRERHNMDAWRLWTGNELASEYELYFQWSFAKYPARVAIRPLRFLDTGDLNHTLMKKFDFVALHDDLRVWKNVFYWKEHWQRYSLTKNILISFVLILILSMVWLTRRSLASFASRPPLRALRASKQTWNAFILRIVQHSIVSFIGFIILLPILYHFIGCRHNCPE